ncbi:golgin subfamily A member 6-like protein 22 [Cimex lectularius]|uniref:Uncharacterized protein n=1 Tax=Cimex lectularius TaxID=79782 RepID=A0A8I6RYP6_CIMLE|nr:golgin subfamily A member 6-like protein 22 [Cimex lectularius]
MGSLGKMRRSRAMKGDSFQEWKARKDLEAQQSRMTALIEQKEKMRKQELSERERIRKNEMLAVERMKRKEMLEKEHSRKREFHMEGKSRTNDTANTWPSVKQEIPDRSSSICNDWPNLTTKEIIADQTKLSQTNVSIDNCKKSGSLTFSQWLHKKEQARMAEIREKEARKQEQEAREWEQQEQSRRAVREWMEKTKYRTLDRHYRKHNAQEAHKRMSRT